MGWKALALEDNRLGMDTSRGFGTAAAKSLSCKVLFAGIPQIKQGMERNSS
ncbi:MAG: hypothetical protein WC926_00605 [Candidatus Paceibacterota bacterium]|jgi:hypothetical protein